MQRRHFSRAVFAPVLAVSLLLGACSSNDPDSGDQDSGAPVTGGTLVDLQNFAGGEPDHIDPALAADAQSAQIAELVFDGLTETAEDGVVRPAVAASVESDAAARQWTFRLRDDVQFDNSDPVRPSDFKFAWERVASPELESQMAYHLQSIEGFEDVAEGSVTTMSGVVANDEDNTLVVTLTETQRDFDAMVSLPVFSPVPAQVFAAAGEDELLVDWEQGVMVGNGPFQMAEPWERGQSITLRRNPNYYGGLAGHKAYLDTVEFRISQNLDSAFTDFETGGGQVGRIPPGRFADVTERYGDGVINPQLVSTEYWGFNMRSETVGGQENLELRQAIAVAADRSDIVEKVYSGARDVATGFVPPAIPGYEESTRSNERDVEEARRLLATWGRDLPELRVSFPAGVGHEEKATILAQNLNDAGIPARPDPLDRMAYGQALRAGTLDMFRMTWRADYLSYDNFITPLFSTSAVGQSNNTNYSNPQLDAVLVDAANEAEESRRSELYRDAENLMLDDQVVLPLSWETAGLVVSDDVRDLAAHPLGQVLYQKVWLAR